MGFGDGLVGHSEHALARCAFQVDFGKGSCHEVAAVVQFENDGHKVAFALRGAAFRNEPAAQLAHGVDGRSRFVGHAEVGVGNLREDSVVSLGQVGPQLESLALRHHSQGRTSLDKVAGLHQYGLQETANRCAHRAALCGVAQAACRRLCRFEAGTGLFEFALADEFFLGERFSAAQGLFGEFQFSLCGGGGVAVGDGGRVDHEERLPRAHAHAFGERLLCLPYDAGHGGRDGGLAALCGKEAAAHFNQFGKSRGLHFVELEPGRFGLGIGKMDFARVCRIVAFAFVGLAFVVVAFVVVVRMARGKEHSRGDGYAKEEYLFHCVRF